MANHIRFAALRTHLLPPPARLWMPQASIADRNQPRPRARARCGTRATTRAAGPQDRRDRLHLTGLLAQQPCLHRVAPRPGRSRPRGDRSDSAPCPYRCRRSGSSLPRPGHPQQKVCGSGVLGITSRPFHAGCMLQRKAPGVATDPAPPFPTASGPADQRCARAASAIRVRHPPAALATAVRRTSKISGCAPVVRYSLSRIRRTWQFADMRARSFWMAGLPTWLAELPLIPVI